MNYIHEKYNKLQSTNNKTKKFIYDTKKNFIFDIKEPICETKECIIGLKPIPKDKLIVIKDIPYNVSKLQKWINSQQSDVKTDVYRRPLNEDEIHQIKKKYMKYVAMKPKK